MARISNIGGVSTAVLDSRYLQIPNNLSDLSNVATARTNLGLVSGGSGDIWVHRSGDTMTGDLIFTNAKQIKWQNTSGTPLRILDLDTGNNLNINRTGVAGNLQLFGTNFVIYDPNVTPIVLYQSSAVSARMIVRGDPSQTGNLTEWQNSTGGVGTKITKNFEIITSTPGGVTNYDADKGVMGAGQTITTATNRASNIRGALFGSMNIAVNSGITDTGALDGVYNEVYTNANHQGSMDTLVGGYYIGTHGGPGDLTNLYAGRFLIRTLSQFTAGHTLSNVYGNYIAWSNAGGGTVVNVYGLYITAISGATTSNYAIYTNAGLVHFGDSLDLASGKNITLVAGNIITDTTTGAKIGAATSQKLGFWNATPIVQPTTAVTAATFAANTSGIVDDTATWGGYTIGQVVQALKNTGLLA